MTEDEPLSPYHFFQLQSRFVWDRIAFARKMNLRISETSVTEELLYHFYQYFEAFRVPVRLFESVEEHRNGSDLEILLKTKNGYILLACQAKISYKTGNYRSFHHWVGGARQIDLLLDYARHHGGIAQYLFYNFVPDWMMLPTMSGKETLADYGITHLAANELIYWIQSYETTRRKVPIPHFNTFHPVAAIPLHELICDFLRDDLAHLRTFPAEQASKLRYYNEADVSDANSWQRISSLATIGYIEEKMLASEQKSETGGRSSEKQQAPPIFKPKFRLVVGGQSSGHLSNSYLSTKCKSWAKTYLPEFIAFKKG